MIIFKSFLSLFIVISLFFTPVIYAEQEVATEDAAEEEEEEEEEKEPLRYFLITPNIMTSYQTKGRKIGYIVVQVQVVVRGDDNYDLVIMHLPLIQDALIDFFNRQDKKSIQDLSLRERLRVQAKERIAEVISEEVGQDIVENLLFTQYVFQ